MSPNRSSLNPEDDNLSSWGSVENAPTSSSTAAAAAAASRPRERRLSAPFRSASAGRGATSGSHSTRDVTASSSNVASVARRRTGVTNTAGGGGDSSSDSRGAVRSRSALRGATTTGGATSGFTDERPPWNQYTSGKACKAKQPAVGTCGATRIASPGPSVGMANARRKKPSADNSSGMNGGTGAMRARCHDETETGEKEEESVESELDAAAPSQQEIQRMIDRIRRETDQEIMRSAGAVGSSSKHRAAFEVRVIFPHLLGDHTQYAWNIGLCTSTSAAATTVLQRWERSATLFQVGLGPYTVLKARPPA